MSILNIVGYFLKIPAIPYLLYYKYLAVKNKKNKNSNVSIDISKIDDYRFGFFGELGYALSVWWPYLNFISNEFDIKLKTIGLPGSHPFVDDFACDHIEVDIPQGDMWGSDTNLSSINIQEKVVLPSQLGAISIEKKEWLNNSMHVFYDTKHYARLNFSQYYRVSEFENTIIINIKNHYNWSNTSIENFYSKDDISKICEAYSDKTIYLNAPKFWKEPYTIYFDQQFHDLLQKHNNLYSLDEKYSLCKDYNEINSLQISILKSSAVIFATQGGNAILSLLCNDNVRILMRGGEDYPDYISLSRIKNCKLKIAYDIEDLINLN